jgi:membrane-associated phospholipid phosphatase
MGDANSQPAARHRFLIPIDRKGTRHILPWFLIPFGFFLLLAQFTLITSGKGMELQLRFQDLHHPISDYFFKYFTYLGDGVFVGVVILILLLFVQVRAGLFVLVASLVDSVVVQYLKRSVFGDSFRPSHYLLDHEGFKTIPGVELHERFSFPSGHTAAAFCLYFGLTLVVRKKIPAFVFFLVALGVGYSRIHLNQHFLQDVYVGSILGAGIAALCYPIFYPRSRPFPKGFLDQPMIRLR